MKLNNGGKARAINEALSLAKNAIIVTIDADIVLYENALKNIVKNFFDL